MLYEGSKKCYLIRVIFPVLLRYLTRFIGNVIYLIRGEKGNPWSGNRMFDSFHYFTIELIFSSINQIKKTPTLYKSSIVTLWNTISWCPSESYAFETQCHSVCHILIGHNITRVALLGQVKKLNMIL